MGQVTDSGIPHWATWLDSLEGVPEWPQPKETHAEREARGTALERGHEAFGWVGTVLPGLGVAFGVAAIGQLVAKVLGTQVLGFEKSPISEITIAVVIGLTIRNTIGLPAVYERGLRLCGREILRFGIILLGLRLSLAAVGQVGLVGLPIILACIAA